MSDYVQSFKRVATVTSALKQQYLPLYAAIIQFAKDKGPQCEQLFLNI